MSQERREIRKQQEISNQDEHIYIYKLTELKTTIKKH